MPAQDPVQSYVSELAGQLRKDPVQVDQAMDNGDAAQVRTTLKEKAESLDLPVYVALVASPPGGSEATADQDLALALHEQLGSKGIYIVATPQGEGSVQVFGELWPEVAADSLALAEAAQVGYDAVRQTTGERAADPDATPEQAAAGVSDSQAVKAAITLDAAAVRPPSGADGSWRPVVEPSTLIAYEAPSWATQQIPPAGASAETADQRPTSGSFPVLAGVLTFVVLAVVLQRIAAYLLARRMRPERLDIEDLRGQATRETRALRDLLASPAEFSGSVNQDAVGSAIECRETAESLLLRGESRTLQLDLVGALVLARTGTALLKALAYQPCLVNPLHGRAVGEAPIGGRTVPVCRRCEHRVAGGEPLQFLSGSPTVDRPYYEEDSVYARTGYGALEDRWWQQLGEPVGERR